MRHREREQPLQLLAHLVGGREARAEQQAVRFKQIEGLGGAQLRRLGQLQAARTRVRVAKKGRRGRGRRNPPFGGVELLEQLRVGRVLCSLMSEHNMQRACDLRIGGGRGVLERLLDEAQEQVARARAHLAVAIVDATPVEEGRERGRQVLWVGEEEAVVAHVELKGHELDGAVRVGRGGRGGERRHQLLEETALLAQHALGQPLAQGVEQPEGDLEMGPGHLPQPLERAQQRGAAHLLGERGVHARDALEESRELAPVREEGLLRLVGRLEVEVVRIDASLAKDEEQCLQLPLVRSEIALRGEKLAQPADIRVQERERRVRRLHVVAREGLQQQRQRLLQHLDGAGHEHRRARRGRRSARQTVPTVEELEAEGGDERAEARRRLHARARRLRQHRYDAQLGKVFHLVSRVHSLLDDLLEHEARAVVEGAVVEKRAQRAEPARIGHELDRDPRHVQMDRVQARGAQGRRCAVQLQDRVPRVGHLRQAAVAHAVLDARGRLGVVPIRLLVHHHLLVQLVEHAQEHVDRDEPIAQRAEQLRERIGPGEREVGLEHRDEELRELVLDGRGLVRLRASARLQPCDQRALQ
eukprot:jgi/Chrpa1/8644/Chrysochromulina_OHIO_Genome00003584-RA